VGEAIGNFQVRLPRCHLLGISGEGMGVEGADGGMRGRRPGDLVNAAIGCAAR